MRDAYEKLFADCGLIVMPTTPFVAPANVDWKRRDPPMEALKPSMSITTNTVINLRCDWMSLPVGFVPAKDNDKVMLPVGMPVSYTHLTLPTKRIV